LTSLQFTEVMRGYASAGATATTHAEFEAAAAAGKNTNGALMFELTVTIANVDEFITSPTHPTKADGFIESAIVGGRSPVTGGVINLLVDAGDPTRKQMKYRLMFTGADGHPYTLVGFKDISGQTFASAWPETTTLYTTILAGHVADGQSGPTVARGVLHIRPEDFLFRQLFSFRVQGPSLVARTQALNRFGVMFLGKLWDVYGHQVGPL
jgi:cholesterol oxidase